ncbi:zinc finger protein 319 isoform X2 [Carassius gibelio]|uniref:zinc finger protein 319 isoform X2 n=1 Tax=Carassius gibelio TaxID=101364 RepID=UPI0022797C35|nr:zinc finger protein 319 isoform X2 [Carassius gibelio]
MIHITVKQRGQQPRPRRCHTDATLFTCPFCTTDVCKPRQYHQIMTHIAGHKLRAVEYGDHVMYSCSICCGKDTKHFHCCQCPKTYVNKGDLKQHLSSAHPIATCTPKQEPVSYPLQESPSHQQPAPHPTPEPPSQLQPASQPQELDLQQTAPPAIERKLISMQSPSRLHITVKQRGQQPRPRRCHTDATLFTCPFCTTDVCKPRQYHQIMTHIAGHKLRAVEYGDHVMYSCSICCGKKTKHFHCCQCPKTYFNKGDLKQHLSSAHPIATCTPKPQPVSHPLQETPSHQQPAPHPTPEPPSQLQPASQPQELDLQQATSHSQELASFPAIERKQISVQCPRRHITVKQRGQEPRPQRCHTDATLFTCPFCTTDVCKPRQYHQIMTHIAGHKVRAVEYGDHVMYSCNIGCGKRPKHFHCCKCPKTYINKSDLKRHLCSAHPMAPETQPVGRPLQLPSLQQPAPCSLKLAAHPVMVKRKQISVQCPHCGLNLNSKNLKKHIERKHHEVLHPETSVLPAQCVDKKNGLYVVSESFSEPCTFIHVVKKFWGSSHKVMCEMDICNSRVEMAQKSELLVEQCVHLNSVDYTCDVAPSEDLSEHVLTEMVEQKWIGDIRKKQCLKLQHQAESKGATFTSLVTIGGPDYMYYVSIYEPKVSHYSKMGRVLVNYNAQIKTWNCPCSKGRKPCVHQSIAKWCLYQMKQQLFQNLPETEEGIEPAQPEDLDSLQFFEKWVPMTG